ncbi:MAG: hypothetical protein WC710_14030 [Gallionella sp.]|jgi:hypothetical protein
MIETSHIVIKGGPTPRDMTVVLDGVDITNRVQRIWFDADAMTGDVVPVGIMLLSNMDVSVDCKITVKVDGE